MALAQSVLDEMLQLAFQAHQRGELDAAESAYRQILEQSPQHPDALHLSGLIYKARGDLVQAETLITQAIAARPDFASPYYNLGNVLQERGQADAALKAYRAALVYQADYPEAYYSIGNILRECDDWAGALSAFNSALELRPDYLEARHNRANLLREMGQAVESVQELEQVVAAQPSLAEAHYNLALSLFMLGRMREGGAHYEWRWQSKGFTTPRRHFKQPVWDGSRQPNQTLLIYAEQGLGDTLQFIRFIHQVRPKVGAVVVEVPPNLHRLVSHALGDVALVVKQGQPLPPFDFHVAMLSLPWRLGFDLADLSMPHPYLQAEQGRAQRWGQYFSAGMQRGLRVGLNWQGNPQAKIDKGRSLPLRLFEPLAKIPNLRLISLQKNAGIEQLEDLPPSMRVERLPADYDAGSDAFLDAAAVLENIDVFVTTDTALAHLAGALGRPTLLLLKKVPDWRWGLCGHRTVWYPKMQLFRQEQAGDWVAPIAALAETLADWPESL